jgi:hypothetical protein
MSYILDALQKAERDRLREDPKELDDFVGANWNPYEPEAESTSVIKKGAVALLLLILLGAGSYLVLVTPVSDSTQPLVLVPQQAPVAIIEVPQPLQLLKESVPTTSTLSLPAVGISGHMFIARGSASNRLFTGQRILKAGDKIDQHWTLLAIGLNGFRIQSGERTEYLPYR